MSNLLPAEKNKFETLFGMSTGYVLDFSDTTFGKFFFDVAEVDIHSSKYTERGTSKAKKLRAFWETEPDAVVGKVLLALLARWAKSSDPNPDGHTLLLQCRAIGNRMAAGREETTCTLDPLQLAEQPPWMEQAVHSDTAMAIGTAPAGSIAVPSAAMAASAQPTKPTTASLRCLLLEIFKSDDDLNAFCIDHFPTVHQRFTGSMNRVQKHNEMLVLIDAGDLWARLTQLYPGELARLSSLVGLALPVGNPK